MLLVAASLALIIGLTLGLLGGGGSILTLPVLVYVLHVEAKEAIASSLLVVGTTALVSAAAHARARNVDLRTGAIFGAASMGGAFAGGRVAGSLPGNVLLGMFAAVMLVTAIAMMRPRREPEAGERRLAIGRVIGAGVAVGVVAGLVGAGGASLLVIALQSFAGFAGHITHAHIDWQLTGVITGVAVAGSLAGARLAKHLSTAALRGGFAWFVLAMAVFMVWRQVSLAAAAVTGVASLIAVFVFSRRSAGSHKDTPAPLARGEKAEQRA
jgi:hypothetical protein